MTFKTYKGFSPKQYIPFEIIVVNEKKVKLSKIKVILIQVSGTFMTILI